MLGSETTNPKNLISGSGPKHFLQSRVQNGFPNGQFEYNKKKLLLVKFSLGIELRNQVLRIAIICVKSNKITLIKTFEHNCKK